MVPGLLWPVSHVAQASWGLLLSEPAVPSWDEPGAPLVPGTIPHTMESKEGKYETA
jgi:hypothetical protein